MNNIFKVIWNHATQTWTAVGELASAKGKSKSVKLAAISTALLIVTGGAQTAFASDNDKAITDSAKQGSSTAKTATIQHDASMQGGLAISPDRVSDQFKGGDRYRQAVSSTNIAGATVYAYDGIAIGSGTVAGTAAVGGNGHVAIGLMARANGAKTNGAAVALGAYAVAEEQEAIAIGNQAYANKAQAVSIGNAAQSVGNGSVAVGNQSQSKEFNSTAVGDGSTAEDARSTALGSKSSSKGDSSTSIGNKAKVDGTLSTGVGSSTTLKGSNIASLGSGSNISSNNVSALGAGITVGDKRDGAVVLGYGSDAGKETTKVMAVNSAVAEGSPLVYSGFWGKLGGTDTDGTNKEATGKQGNVVSVGSEGNERQIKHVAAGQITDRSTDAINGSQLYQVAKTLGTAANQTANALGVTLNANGTLSPFSHQLNVTTSGYTQPNNATNVTTALTQLNDYVNAGWSVGNNTTGVISKILPNGKVNFVNGEGTTSTVTKNADNSANVTFNVKKDVTANTTTGLEANGSNNVLNVGENGVSVVSGTITTATKNTNGEVKADDAKANQVATVKNVVDAINSAGFIVSNGQSDKSELINAGKTLTLKGENGVNVEQNGSNFTFSIDSSKLLEGKTGGITVNQDKKAGETDAGKATVNDNDATKLATVKNVADAINGAKWFAKVENLSDSMNVQAQKDQNADAQAMGAGDILTLKADKNLAVKREGKNVTYGLASKIEVDSITVKSKTPGEATTTFENGKVTNLKDHLTTPEKVAADKAAVPNAEEVKTPTPTELTADKKKEAATVNDVLNAGWNLKANGKQVAAVTNGKGVDFESDGSITITPTVENGIAKMKFAVNTDASIDKNKGSIKEAATDPKADNAGKVTVVTGTPVRKADGSMETQKEANDREGNKLATVGNVVDAINSAKWFAKVENTNTAITDRTQNDTADKKAAAIGAGETLTLKADKNLAVKREGKNVTYGLASEIDVNSVKAKNGVTIGSGDNTTTITSDAKGLNLADKNGAPTNINNVKDADLNSTSKQAVNGSQLYATNEKVANLGTTVNNLSKVINHHAGAIDSLDRKVNKHSKQARAGIAGANAAAALPQAYTQGKAMVAAAAGTFKGQNALAVGYSRISDNGKVILKLQGNANTSGDVGAGVGVGYQW